MSRLLKNLLISLTFAGSSLIICFPAGGSQQLPQEPHIDAACDTASRQWQRLKAGEVVVEMLDRCKTKVVSARILIAAPADRVWAILANPFEFEKRISPRMQRVSVLHDSVDRSTLKCKFDVLFPLPPIGFVIESVYEPGRHVTFQRRAGVFKDFRGCWCLAPHDNGTTTEVIYSMYVDPGVPVPQWIVRKGVTCELPVTLTRLRDRIAQVDTAGGEQVKKSIHAAKALEQRCQVVNAVPAPLSE
ncbi:MAG: SRPBCC family protein [Cyanobacteria bacterium]|nr:SRPBCC family protein [Cyanobacteriota bacterium]